MGEAAGATVPPAALAVGAVDGKVYAIGGLTEDGKVVKSVDIYDPVTRTWSRGPELPGAKHQGFAPSAFEVGGKLYLNGGDGPVLRLGEGGDRWDVAGKLTPRLTHRLLPGIANDLWPSAAASRGTHPAHRVHPAEQSESRLKIVKIRLSLAFTIIAPFCNSRHRTRSPLLSNRGFAGNPTDRARRFFHPIDTIRAQG